MQPKIKIEWESRVGIRAGANMQGTVEISTSDPVSVFVHEQGHHIEYRVVGVREMAQEFLDYRVGGQAPQSLKKLFPDADFGTWEMGRSDDFGKAFSAKEAWYVGKVDSGNSTEIISMGVQKLYDDPVGFAANDPQYFKFILGILDGSLRRP